MELLKELLELNEAGDASKSKNPSYGYHGEFIKDGHQAADRAFSKAHAQLKKIFGDAKLLTDVKKPNLMIRDFLDSNYGRHLKGHEDDSPHLVKLFKKFKRDYNPELFEETDLPAHTKRILTQRIKHLLKSFGESENWTLRLFTHAAAEVKKGTAENEAIKSAFKKYLGLTVKDSDFHGSTE